MRKLFLHACILVMVALVSVSCDKEEVVDAGTLPTKGTAFLNSYFKDVRILSVIKEKEGLSGTEYEVLLDNGVEVKFDKNGEWTAVDAQGNSVLSSTAFILTSITAYVEDNYSNAGINGIEKEKYGFDVELTNSLDLVFDTDGKFVRIDP